MTQTNKLTELMVIARKLNEALAKANLIGIEKLIADEHEGRLTEAGVETIINKKMPLGIENPDKNFVCYNIPDAELIERNNEMAAVRCLQTVTSRRVFETGTFEPYIKRGKIIFVRRGNRWMIFS